MKRAECRSCHAEIAFVATTHGGKMPIDFEPVADGTIAVVAGLAGEIDPPLGVVLTDDALARARARGAPLHRSHFASCPQAAEWRNRKEKTG